MFAGLVAIGVASLLTYGMIRLFASRPQYNQNTIIVVVLGLVTMVFLWGMAIPSFGNLTIFGFKIWMLAGLLSAVGTVLFYFSPGTPK